VKDGAPQTEEGTWTLTVGAGKLEGAEERERIRAKPVPTGP
jgi:hypothetical protein